MFVDVDLGDSSGLRILSIEDGRGNNVVYIPLEPNYYVIGDRTENAAALFQDGVLTKDQFIFEVLSAVLENSPGDGTKISSEFLKPFKEASLKKQEVKY